MAARGDIEEGGGGGRKKEECQHHAKSGAKAANEKKHHSKRPTSSEMRNATSQTVPTQWLPRLPALPGPTCHVEQDRALLLPRGHEHLSGSIDSHVVDRWRRHCHGVSCDRKTPTSVSRDARSCAEIDSCGVCWYRRTLTSISRDARSWHVRVQQYFDVSTRRHTAMVFPYVDISTERYTRVAMAPGGGDLCRCARPCQPPRRCGL